MSNDRQLFSMLAAGAIGNLIEWYNFLMYAFLAQTISTLFFPSNNSSLGLIKVYGVFAVSFLVRPLGSLLFGYIGDKYGRQRSLMIALIMMAAPTMAVAFLPTYTSWGYWSPLLFLLLHILQGLSIGGEYTGSVIYLGEHVPKQHRSLWVSTVPTTTALGILFGSLVSLCLVNIFTAEQLLQWAWRLPFAIGSILCLFGAYLRRHMPETPVFEALQKNKELEKNSLTAVFAEPHVKSNIFRLIMLVCCYGVFYQTLYIWMPSYLEQTVHFSKHLALLISSSHTFIFLLLLPCCGWLCDRIGAKKLLITTSGFLLVLCYPLFMLLMSKSLWQINASMLIFTLFFSAYAASVTSIMVAIFSAKLRYTAVSFGYNIGFAVFGGTAPLVLTSLLTISNNGIFPAFYLIACALCAFVAIMTLPQESK